MVCVCVCVCKENIITGSMTLRRSSMKIIIVRKSRQISCVPICYIMIEMSYFFSPWYFVRKHVLCVSHFICRLYLLDFYHYFFPGRFEQTARRTHGRDGRTRIGRRALPVQKRTFQNDRCRKVSRPVVRLYYTYMTLSYTVKTNIPNQRSVNANNMRNSKICNQIKFKH